MSAWVSYLLGKVALVEGLKSTNAPQRYEVTPTVRLAFSKLVKIRLVRFIGYKLRAKGLE